jgi:hypothetical protein
MWQFIAPSDMQAEIYVCQPSHVWSANGFCGIFFFFSESYGSHVVGKGKEIGDRMLPLEHTCSESMNTRHTHTFTTITQRYRVQHTTDVFPES